MPSKSNEKVLCFGEILIRLQASQDQFFADDNTINQYFGGSEMNVAATLAHLGMQSKMFTSLPKNNLTTEILSTLEHKGIDTSLVLIGGDRIGIYYLQSANGLSKGDVIYDRKYSAFDLLDPNIVDWDLIFEDCNWFHFSAITPALNHKLVDILLTALKKAREKCITISVDLNYRSKLWNYGKYPIEIMPILVDYADVIMGNIWASNKMLGIGIQEYLERDTPIEYYQEAANLTAKEMFKKFPRCNHIANTFRFMDNPTHNLLYGTYHTNEGNYISSIHETNEVIDRIGSGDAFMGGLIFGIKQNYTPQQIVNKATQVAFDKLFVAGDFIN